MASSSLFPQYSSLFTSGLLCHDIRPSSSRDELAKAGHEKARMTINTTVSGGGLAAPQAISQSAPAEPGAYLSFLSFEDSRANTPLPCHSLTRARSLGSRETCVLPSAKPAPSKSLPDVPAKRRTFRRTLRLTITSDAEGFQGPDADKPFSPSLQSSPMLSPGESFSPFAFPPYSSPRTPPLTMASEFSNSTESLPMSTTSPSPHEHSRSAALAALEGRRKTPIRTCSTFINMSDEEDTDTECDRIPSRVSRRVSFQRIKSRVDSYLSSMSNLNFLDFMEDAEPTPRTYKSFMEFNA